MKVTFIESEMDAESIEQPIDYFETCHALTIITGAITLFKNNEISPFAYLQEF